jgi:DNA-directed RNA polymerase specialized sigma subunit
MDCRRIGSLISEFDASERGEVLSRLVQRIVQLPPTPKKVLAMYYYENLQPAEIAACLGLTEHDIDLIRAQTVRLLQNDLFHDLEQPNRLNWIPLNISGLRSPWLEG